MTDRIYLPSTRDGKTWSIYTHKPDGRPAYAYAVEGILEQEDGRMRSFTTELFGSDRHVREDIPGRATAKAKEAAVARLIARMTDDGLIGESL